MVAVNGSHFFIQKKAEAVFTQLPLLFFFDFTERKKSGQIPVGNYNHSVDRW
jgi:hypothetical protein